MPAAGCVTIKGIVWPGPEQRSCALGQRPYAPGQPYPAGALLLGQMKRSHVSFQPGPWWVNSGKSYSSLTKRNSAHLGASPRAHRHPLSLHLQHTPFTGSPVSNELLREGTSLLKSSACGTLTWEMFMNEWMTNWVTDCILWTVLVVQ